MHTTIRAWVRFAVAAPLAAVLTACAAGSTSQLTPLGSGQTNGGSTTAAAANQGVQAGAGSAATPDLLSDLTPERRRQCIASGTHCIARVLLVSIDGMHAVDLARFTATHKDSALAKLAALGVTYANAHAPVPTDSFPGLLALTTGGHPSSTGVYYEVSYDRTLYAPRSNCTGTPGTVVAFDESIDYNANAIDGGGGINPAALTQQRIGGACKPVFPHDFLRVNTIFEAVKAHGGRTAWSDKEQSYDILNGPSGKGVDDLFDREIAAGGTTASILATERYDDTKVAAILDEIDGKSSGGAAGAGVPALFGLNFQAVSVGQKLAAAERGVGPRGGYLDASGTPTPLLEQALEHTDASIGKFVDELTRRGLAQTTLVIVSAKHGQAPIDLSLRRAIGGAAGSFGTQLAANGVGFIQTDDLALIWLTDQTTANMLDASRKLEAPSFKSALGYANGKIYGATDLPAGWGPAGDARTPDFAVKVDLGAIYTGGTKIAEHGGFSEDDSHVALLVSRAACSDAALARHDVHGGVVTQAVQTTQVAPTILDALDINAYTLRAVALEGTPYLPGLTKP